MAGYAYGDLEPKERCPFCKAMCCADFVDVGIGLVQCGPFHCEACGGSEIGPHDEPRQLTAQEESAGWYGPGERPGSTANLNNEGRHVRHFEADTAYRVSVGAKPRYDSNGRLMA